MTTPPSLPPAMDPEQMNDTPPCPNATPEWAERAYDEIMDRLPNYSPHEKRAVAAKIIRDHAPTAPVPATSELCGRLALMKNQRIACTADDTKTFTDAIAALKQLAPLAGEVERLKDLLREVGDSHKQGLEHVKNQERTLTEYSTEVADLRQKLAASERECVEAKKDSNRIDLLAYNPDYIDLDEFDEDPDGLRTAIDRIMESGTPKVKLRTQLAAAKLDADALASCLEVFANLDVQHMVNQRKAHAHPVFGLNSTQFCLGDVLNAKQVLAAHRATGGAGEKAT